MGLQAKPTGGDLPHILWALSSMELGGTEMYTLQILPLLMKRARITVLLTEARGELFDDLSSTGVRIIEAPLRGKFHRGRIARATQIIRELAPDVVHTHSLSTHYLVRIAAIMAGVPVILPHMHGMAGEAFSRGLDLRERRLLRSTDRVLFVSEAARSDFERVVLGDGARLGRLREKLEVVHDGLDLSAFAPSPSETIESLRQEHGIPDGAPVIGKIGRLHPIKNLELLIEVVAGLRVRIPSIRCLIVGAGSDEYRAKLEALCRDKGVSGNVIFTGFRRDVGRYLNLFDLSLLTSRSEGLPRMVLESFATGTPVVASDIPGMSEIIEEGVSGYLAPLTEPGVFVERIVSLVASPERLAAFSQEARRQAEKYDLGRYVDHLMEIYQAALARQPRGVRAARTIFRAKYNILKRI